MPDDAALQVGAPISFVDNGDGTITDLNTGLMWEKKSLDGGLHDSENAYWWSGDGAQETIWDWLDDINTEGGTGFAGHSDWRIPSVRELESVIDYEHAFPSVGPVFNNGCIVGCTVTTCSCIEGSSYWSSTTAADTPADAFVVEFGSPFVGVVTKAIPLMVRAVRAGL